MICSGALACKHTYISESFVGLCTYSNVEKCLVHRGECVTTGGLYGPTHLCVARLNCTKKVHSIFFDEVRLGEGVWRGGGWSMFQGVGVCMGFSEGGGVI